MNVINDPWLYVRYLNNEVKQVSVRQAFIDAEIIKNIESPTFHGVKVVLYDVPVIQFLSTLLLASYFKPETNFKARNKFFSKELYEKGWDIDIILDYLDTWQNRFNLEDDKYPFLQDVRLKTVADYNNTDLLKWVTKLNIVSPNSGNPIFEHNIEQGLNIAMYKPELDELVYLLLYFNSIGTSINADNFPGKSLNANCTMFALNSSNNLKNIICCNSLPLRDSYYKNERDDIDENYDKPIWELDNRDDVIKKYKLEDIHKNNLLCSFFPSLPLYIAINDNQEVVDFVLANRKHPNEKECIIDKEIRDDISNMYMQYNPYSIKVENKDKDAKYPIKYKSWSSSIKLINLCIEITKKLPIGFACNIVSLEDQANKNEKTNIYYREYDKYKCNVLSFGKYEVSTNILNTLQKDENRDKAEQFQSNLNLIYSKFNILKQNEINKVKYEDDKGISKEVIDTMKLKFSKYAEDFFFSEFIFNIDKEDIILTSIDTLIKYANKIVMKSSDISKNPLRYANAYSIFSGSLNKLRKDIKNGVIE